MTDIENSAKKLNESKLAECPMDDAAGATTMGADQGSPVSVNVSLNASGKEHVNDLLNMMKNAGLGGAEEVSAAPLAPRMDMEEFRDVVDAPAPAMPHDHPGQESLNDEEADGDLDVRLDTVADSIDDLEADMHEYNSDEDGDGSDLGMDDEDEDDLEDEDEDDLENESYANEPDANYSDHQTMTKDLSGGINRQKKSYAKAQDGDNAMAVEDIAAQLYAKLAEKQIAPNEATDSPPKAKRKKEGPADPDAKAAKRRQAIEKHAERKAAKSSDYDYEFDDKPTVKKFAGKHGTSHDAGDDDHKD